MPTYSISTNGRWYRLTRQAGQADQTTVGSRIQAYAYGYNTKVKRPKPTGWLSPTDYTAEYYNFRYGMGTVTYRSTFPDRVTTDTGCLSLNGTGAFDSEYYTSNWWPTYADMAEAQNDALLKLKDAKVNAPVSVIEARKTAQMIAASLNGIIKGVDLFRDRRYSDLLKHFGMHKRDLSGPGNAWLSYQYGWKPALSDVYNAAEGLAEFNRIYPFRVAVKGNFVDERVVSKVTLGQNMGAGIVSACESIIEESKGVFVRLDYEPTDASLIHRSRTGLSNPVAVAWELMPWSFIVDWAWPLGDFFSGLDAVRGWKFISGSRTYWGTSRARVSPRRNLAPGCLDADFVGVRNWKKIQRERVASPPFILPPLPRFPDLTWANGRIATSLSLLANAFGVKHPKPLPRGIRR